MKKETRNGRKEGRLLRQGGDPMRLKMLNKIADKSRRPSRSRSWRIWKEECYRFSPTIFILQEPRNDNA